MIGTLAMAEYDTYNIPATTTTVVNTNTTPEGPVRFPRNVVTASAEIPAMNVARGGLDYIDDRPKLGYQGTRPDLTASATGGIRGVRNRGALNGAVIAAQPTLGVRVQGNAGNRGRNLGARATADTDVASPREVIAAFLRGGR